MAEEHPIPTNPRFNNLTGRVFGRLTVESYAGRHGHSQSWNCLCVCGKRTVTCNSSLKSGATRSCGCLHKDAPSKRTHKHSGRTFGRNINRREYWIYFNIIARCYNKKCRAYPNYGGRGIKMCKRWLDSFVNFLADVGPRPSPKHSIDRYPDNDGDYEPDNVRWATPSQQTRNQRTNHFITLQGQTLCLEDWSKRTGIQRCTILMRIRRGWSEQDAITVSPVGNHKKRFR